MKKFFLFMVVMITMIACSNDDWYANDCINETSVTTRASLNGEYLDIKATSCEDMSQEDWNNINKAIFRMTIKCENGLSYVQESCGRDLNMSETLFNFIKDGFEHANKLTNENGQTKSNKNIVLFFIIYFS